MPAQNPPTNPPIKALVNALSLPRTLSSIQVVAPNVAKPNATHTHYTEVIIDMIEITCF